MTQWPDRPTLGLDYYKAHGLGNDYLVFEEGEGGAGSTLVRHAGGFSDWQRLGRRLSVHHEAETAGENAPSAAAETRPSTARAPRSTPARPKLSYKLKRELSALPAQIETLEEEVRRLEAVVEAEGFYQRPYEEEVQPVLSELESTRAELDRLLGRWVELEEPSAE